jgi:CBS domain-containing protein
VCVSIGEGTQPLLTRMSLWSQIEAPCSPHMKRNEPISKIMTTDVQTVHLGQKLSEVRRMLANGPYHHVPVVSGKKLIGMISATDMLALSLAIYGVDAHAIDAMLDSQHTIESVMSKTLTTISASDNVRAAAELLGEGRFHSLLVVDGENLVGLVTSTDMIRYLLAQY